MPLTVKPGCLYTHKNSKGSYVVIAVTDQIKEEGKWEPTRLVSYKRADGAGPTYGRFLADFQEKFEEPTWQGPTP